MSFTDLLVRLGTNCCVLARDWRPIPIPRELTLLPAASVQRYPSEWMVTDGAGGSCPPRAIERAVVRARAKVDGLPAGFTFHDLRHYLASLLIASGADIKTVQARLRHASASTTLGHLRAPVAGR